MREQKTLQALGTPTSICRLIMVDLDDRTGKLLGRDTPTLFAERPARRQRPPARKTYYLYRGRRHDFARPANRNSKRQAVIRPLGRHLCYESRGRRIDLWRG
jgi:hypothetical protein